MIFQLIAQAQQNSVFGRINPPVGVDKFTSAAGGDIGIIFFASNMIRLITIIAGIWSLFNIIFAGFKYITAANDAKAVETAWESIYMSLIGLLIIVSAFTITALVSFILFGDPGFILSPTLCEAGQVCN